jgi:hypothetical protein
VKSIQQSRAEQRAETSSEVNFESESESYVTADGQSANLSWYKAHIRGLRPDFFFRSEYGIRLTVMFFIPWDALSDERTGLTFVCAAGPCHTTQKTSHVITISPIHWRADCCLATSCKHSSYCCVTLSYVFIAPLPSNARYN